MTQHELRDHIQRLIQRELELPCRAAHTSERYGSAPAIRVFVDGGEHLVLVGQLIACAVDDPLTARPGEVQVGRECTAAEIAELERTTDW